MYTISINHKNIGPTTYNIYRESEAKKEGLTYVHWKEAEQGDWAISDDGYVARVIKRKEYKDKPNKKTNVYIRFPWGYNFFNPNGNAQPLLVKGRKSAYTLSGKPYMEVMAGQEKMKNLALAYVKSKFNADMAIDIAFGVVTDKQRRRWRRMMKTEVFHKMKSDELDKILNDHELTTDYTINLLKETIEVAKNKGDVTNLMRAVDNLQDMHGMKEKHLVKTTERLEQTSTKQLVDNIFEEEKLLAEKITEGQAEDVDKKD
tara:strand:- start:1932 stop:2711 length:780 start_codon:yes stop_codon:yes gene_type:complete